MNCTIRNNGETSVIQLSGRFVFDIHRTFRETYEQALARSETRIIKIDMSQVEYLDSSALGMLLLVKEKAEASKKTVHLQGATGMALKVLEIANFHKIFL